MLGPACRVGTRQRRARERAADTKTGGAQPTVKYGVGFDRAIAMSCHAHAGPPCMD
jgi:hypothetical protein